MSTAHFPVLQSWPLLTPPGSSDTHAVTSSCISSDIREFRQEVHTIPLIPISTVLRPKSLTSFPHIDTKCIQMHSVLEVTPTKTNFFFLRWCFIKFACHMTNNGYALILTTNIQIITKACDKEQCHCITLYLNLL